MLKLVGVELDQPEIPETEILSQTQPQEDFEKLDEESETEFPVTVDTAIRSIKRARTSRKNSLQGTDHYPRRGGGGRSRRRGSCANCTPGSVESFSPQPKGCPNCSSHGSNSEKLDTPKV
jgi:hypothetical protein